MRQHGMLTTHGYGRKKLMLLGIKIIIYHLYKEKTYLELFGNIPRDNSNKEQCTKY